MSNSKLKRRRAEQFNRDRKKRMDLVKDRLENPEKYRIKPSKETLQHAMLFAALTHLT